MSALLQEIRLLGDPSLRRVSVAVEALRAAAFLEAVDRLHRALDAFRSVYGFGRAISAPQIGVAQRFIALKLGEQQTTMVNPRITWRSPQRFTLWDDCMSFPNLVVRVERHVCITVQWTDLEGRQQRWQDLDRATSELLQHEIDHLDGILAVDRALDRESLAMRRALETLPD